MCLTTGDKSQNKTFGRPTRLCILVIVFVEVDIIRNFVSDDDLVEVDIIVAHVDGVNNNNKKRNKAYTAEDVEHANDNLNDIEVPLNKKSNDIVTRKKEKFVAQDYAQIKGVDFDEASILIARLEAIKMFLSLSYSLMFTLYQMDVKSVFINRYLSVEVNHDLSNDVTDMDGVIKKDNCVEVCQDASTDVNNIYAISSTKF